MRDDWPPGPWDHEPDQDGWRDRATGLFCSARRGPLGNWCGYVALPAGHPWADLAEPPADVHGGITFSGPVDGGYLIGFDCAHLGDLVPGVLAYMTTPGFPGETYKDLTFVRTECQRLAFQVAEACPRTPDDQPFPR